MTTDELIKKLQDIQDRVLAEPQDEHEDNSERLRTLQGELGTLLGAVEDLPGEERETILPMIVSFSTQLKDRLRDLNERLAKAKESVEVTKSHAKGAQAYSGKIF